MTDVAINKIQSIQRCVRRARQEHGEAGERFSRDFTRQDAALLNILRACETAIDLANHTVRSRKLGIPTSSRNSFSLLLAEGVIDDSLKDSLTKMIGFRNVAVHQYADVDLAIVEAVILHELDHLLVFTDVVRNYLGSE